MDTGLTKSMFILFGLMLVFSVVCAGSVTQPSLSLAPADPKDPSIKQYGWTEFPITCGNQIEGQNAFNVAMARLFQGRCAFIFPPLSSSVEVFCGTPIIYHFKTTWMRNGVLGRCDESLAALSATQDCQRFDREGRVGSPQARLRVQCFSRI